ncbi:hypothetical protein AB0451_39550 [Streptomyces sp. NPDC052000]|uniref:hypothetical protein n=1 Tax=Streptomyces sp. NPDC052000 TaxID=3155676 RepID=UPI00344F37B1
MGRDERRLWVHVLCMVSRHNTSQDAEDDALCDELAERLAEAVRPVVEDPRYASVISIVDFGPR